MSRRRPPPVDELRARFGANVRVHRERVGVSRHEIGFRAEIVLSAVGFFERGQGLPRIDTFIRLVAALEATPNDLVAGMVWVPQEEILIPGSFDVSSDPDLVAEVAILRAQNP